MAQRLPTQTPDALHRMDSATRLTLQKWSSQGFAPIDGSDPKNQLYLAFYNRGSNPIWRLLLCTPQQDASALGTTFGVVATPNWTFETEVTTSTPFARIRLTEVNDYFHGYLAWNLACVSVSGIRYPQEWVWRAIEHLQDYAGYFGYIRKREVLEPEIRSFLSRLPYQPGQVATLDFRGPPNEYTV
ncbi:hypothetical protein CALVIDRAFT_561246 [Calocera viscosa TUFC12733]|uniref:Uncharacterized protein n=1 Tax=Calocera viscosa (strain TUFC12733) TaxID=1330018 RepID=A0A167Q3T7_CALVF|nr:hypothetical protein CALVIDRAFT_561246 [Calocera viscosa TUFC12733]